MLGAVALAVAVVFAFAVAGAVTDTQILPDRLPAKLAAYTFWRVSVAVAADAAAGWCCSCCCCCFCCCRIRPYRILHNLVRPYNAF